VITFFFFFFFFFFCVCVCVKTGWVDPIPQFLSYPVFAYERGLIGEKAYGILNETADLCVALIEKGEINRAYAGLLFSSSFSLSSPKLNLFLAL
jgi:hypothetical protein